MSDRKQRKFSTVEELTKLAVPEANRIELTYTNLPGLRLAVQPKTGRCKWVYSYVGSDGKRHKVSLGAYPVDAPIKERRASLQAAYARAIEYNNQVEDPEADDPHEVAAAIEAARDQKVKTAVREAQADEWTVAKLGEAYLDALEQNGRRPETIKGYRQRLTVDCKPIAGMPAAAVTEDDVLRVLTPILARGKARHYNLTRQTLQGMFNWAAGRVRKAMKGTQPPRHLRRMQSPVEGIAKADETPPEVSGAREFSTDELPALWWALKRARGQVDLDVAAMMLLTGCRIGETRLAKWADIDLDAATWTIPAADAKGKRDHVVHLSPQAVELLGSRLSRSPWVFPNPNTRDGLVDQQAPGKRLQKLMRTLKLDTTRVSAHSCRKTLDTWTDQHDICSDNVRRRLLNQVNPDQLRRRYSGADHGEAAREVWRRWGEYLDGLAWKQLEKELDAVVESQRAEKTSEVSAA